MYKKFIVNPIKESHHKKTFIQIGEYKICYHPCYELEDPEYFFNGIAQVLRETFLFPIYFTSKVMINKGDTIFDLGANIGTSSILFSKIAGPTGKIFSFEPVMYGAILKNTQMNKIDNIRVIDKAVSDREGKVKIEISDFCLDSSIARREYTRNYYQTTRIVDTISLDFFYDKVGLERIDFIKMDIEGAEELAIRGAKRIIERFHPKWSISSYHIDFENEPQHDKLVHLLQEHGYKIKEKEKRHIYAW